MTISFRTTAFTIATVVAASTAVAQDATRTITNVTGDVYRFQNNNHYALVTVTDTGVVVVDPINADAASWLKDNLTQITNKPITHLIYSHSHGDHASGGSVLGAETVVAHENAPAAIDGVTPTLRVGETNEMIVGDKIFEITYLGAGHGEDMLAVVVRPENVGFITDVAAPKRLPFRTLPSSSVDAWIDQVRKVDTLDFEIFAPAHGNVGVHSDVGDVIIYMETLRSEVLKGLKTGKTIDDLKASVTMDAYSDWLGYDRMRAQNVQGMAEYLTRAGKVN